uniref:JmjC domain-containing protein n=1 Tax=Arcella intermedia TaxID=1963864 RepID=A0A6B2L846_9EUKA
MSLPYGPVPVFRPTLEQFSDFSQFIRSITPQCAPYGLAKVIPPEGWTPRKSGGYEELLAGIKIPSPIKQVVQGKQGCFQLLNIEQNEMTVKDFAEAARERAERHLTDGLGHEEIERKFWRNIQFSPPMYGADMVGSLTDTDLKMWNMRELGTILDLIGISLSGINVPYLYFGMWQAMFSWHTEDMDLYSINYLHFGKPKRWYAIPSEEGKKFERVAAGYFPGMQNECKAFLRHKTTMISPLLLTRYHQITVNTCVQEAGEFMITFPYAYHAGFNHGFNCAESVNFATPEWIDFGSKASRCSCGGGTCEIDMNIFKARYVLARELAPHVTVTDEMVWRKIAQFKGGGLYFGCLMLLKIGKRI